MTGTKIEINCDFCGSKSKKIIKIENDYPISQCRECSLVYVSQLPPVEEGKVLGEYYVDDRSEIEINRVRYAEVTKYLVDEINKLRPQKGKLLDVGCGYGFFLSEAKKSGWQVVGTDLSEVAVEYVREQQNIKDAFYAELTDEKISTQKFDIINLTNVLEHVPSPTETLQSCHRILSDDGFLIIRVPNIDFYSSISKMTSFLHTTNSARAGELSYLASAPPLHLIGFTSKTLRRYFEKTGWETVEIKPSKLSSTRKKFVHNIFESFIKTIYKGSFGKINPSPTILAIGRKSA